MFNRCKQTMGFNRSCPTCFAIGGHCKRCRNAQSSEGRLCNRYNADKQKFLILENMPSFLEYYVRRLALEMNAHQEGISAFYPSRLQAQGGLSFVSQQSFEELISYIHQVLNTSRGSDLSGVWRKNRYIDLYTTLRHLLMRQIGVIEEFTGSKRSFPQERSKSPIDKIVGINNSYAMKCSAYKRAHGGSEEGFQFLNAADVKILTEWVLQATHAPESQYIKAAVMEKYKRSCIPPNAFGPAIWSSLDEVGGYAKGPAGRRGVGCFYTSSILKSFMQWTVVPGAALSTLAIKLYQLAPLQMAIEFITLQIWEVLKGGSFDPDIPQSKWGEAGGLTALYGIILGVFTYVLYGLFKSKVYSKVTDFKKARKLFYSTVMERILVIVTLLLVVNQEEMGEKKAQQQSILSPVFGNDNSLLTYSPPSARNDEMIPVDAAPSFESQNSPRLPATPHPSSAAPVSESEYSLPLLPPMPFWSDPSFTQASSFSTSALGNRDRPDLLVLDQLEEPGLVQLLLKINREHSDAYQNLCRYLEGGQSDQTSQVRSCLLLIASFATPQEKSLINSLQEKTSDIVINILRNSLRKVAMQIGFHRSHGIAPQDFRIRIGEERSSAPVGPLASTPLLSQSQRDSYSGFNRF